MILVCFIVVTLIRTCLGYHSLHCILQIKPNLATLLTIDVTIDQTRYSSSQPLIRSWSNRDMVAPGWNSANISLIIYATHYEYVYIAGLVLRRFPNENQWWKLRSFGLHYLCLRSSSSPVTTSLENVDRPFLSRLRIRTSLQAVIGVRNPPDSWAIGVSFDQSRSRSATSEIITSCRQKYENMRRLE